MVSVPVIPGLGTHAFFLGGKGLGGNGGRGDFMECSWITRIGHTTPSFRESFDILTFRSMREFSHFMVSVPAPLGKGTHTLFLLKDLSGFP
eukprot:jgi/Botrbrau1/9466/Bobra.0252s0087.1